MVIGIKIFLFRYENLKVEIIGFIFELIIFKLFIFWIELFNIEMKIILLKFWFGSEVFIF